MTREIYCWPPHCQVNRPVTTAATYSNYSCDFLADRRCGATNSLACVFAVEQRAEVFRKPAPQSENIQMKNFKQSMPRAAKIFVQLLEKIDYGSLHLIFADGSSQRFSGSKSGVEATLHLHDMKVCEALLARGDIGFGETYINGLWTSPDIAKLIILAVENRTQLSSLMGAAFYQ